MRWIGTFPPHQSGLAVTWAPLVGSRLLTTHGPLPITSVPGCPKVAAWACWNAFSKMNAFSSAGTYFQFASAWGSVIVFVYGSVAGVGLTPVNPNATSDPGARS